MLYPIEKICFSLSYNNEKSVAFIILFIHSIYVFNSGKFRFSKNVFVVYKYPTKFPLSTVDIYLGTSGVLVIVSYQLYKCPFHFSRLIIVSNIFFNKSIAFSKVINPKS